MTTQCFKNRNFSHQKHKMRCLLEYVGDFYNVNIDDIISQTKKMHIVWSRHVIMAIAEENKIPQIVIAETMNRDRSLIPYAHKKVKELCSVDREANSEVKFLVNNVKDKWTTIKQY